MLGEFYKKVLVQMETLERRAIDFDDRLADYDELGNLVLKGIKNITGSDDPLFDWPLDKKKSVKHKMPSIASVKGPSGETILFPPQNLMSF